MLSVVHVVTNQLLSDSYLLLSHIRNLAKYYCKLVGENNLSILPCF